MRATSLVLCLALTACTQFPELDGTISPELENADFPSLVPVESLRAQSEAIVSDPVATTQALDSRVNGLRARAAALQNRTIVDASTRSRLNNAVN